jgi:hypothetical protein
MRLVGGSHIGVRALLVIYLTWFGYCARLSKSGGMSSFTCSYEDYLQRVLNDLEGQAFLRPYDSAARPPPFPSSPLLSKSVNSTGNTQEDREREATCYRRGEGGGGRGAKQ